MARNSDVAAHPLIRGRYPALSEALLAGASAANALAQTSNRERPNILHIMSDRQQWANIAGWSACRTPIGCYLSIRSSSAAACGSG